MNAIVVKSEDFAVRIVNLYRILIKDRHESVLAKQLLRSGTSIGANIAESQGAQSHPDFIAKIHISLKESQETGYWLRLLKRTGYITDPEYNSLRSDLSELIAIIITILKKTKDSSDNQ
jgi:four helix bundle protein